MVSWSIVYCLRMKLRWKRLSVWVGRKRSGRGFGKEETLRDALLPRGFHQQSISSLLHGWLAVATICSHQPTFDHRVITPMSRVLTERSEARPKQRPASWQTISHRHPVPQWGWSVRYASFTGLPADLFGLGFVFIVGGRIRATLGGGVCPSDPAIGDLVVS
jgi:hypothetical protein